MNTHSHKTVNQASRRPLITGHLLQRACACGQHTNGGECSSCDKQRHSLHRSTRNSERETKDAGGVPEIVHEVLRSSGQPLDVATRAFFEPRFAHDFSHVRVHTDIEAAESAEAVNALAYTVGRDIAFGKGQYAPNTNHGMALIAHELTHVVQSAGNVGPASQVVWGNDSFEHEARGTAHAVLNGGSIGHIHSAPGGLLARSDKLGGGDAGARAGLCAASSRTCASEAACNAPDRAGNGVSTSWQLIIRIDVEAPSARDVTPDTVGHTYVEFRESNGTIYTYGFYPALGRTPDPVWRPQVAGCVVHPDAVHLPCTDYSETFNLSQVQYNAALDTAKGFCRVPPPYHLLTSNCTTFAAGIARIAGQTVPPVRGSVSAARFNADNPNTLIDALRARDAARNQGRPR